MYRIYPVLFFLLLIQSVPANLVCYWNFDNNIQDSCNSEHKSRVYGNAGFSEGVLSRRGKSKINRGI